MPSSVDTASSYAANPSPLHPPLTLPSASTLALLLPLPILLILGLPPIPRLWFLTGGLLDGAAKRRATGIQLAARLLRLRVQLLAHGDGLVAAEALAHVDHPALALAVAPLELLALRRQRVDERRPQAVLGRVPLDHDAVGGLETGGEGLAWEGVRGPGRGEGEGEGRTDVFAGGGHGGGDGVWEYARPLAD